MELGTPKVEAFLRLGSIVLLIMTACMVRLDSQKKFMLYLEREITYKYLKALVGLVYVATGAAVYNLLQLGKYPLLASYKGNSKGFYSFLAWSCYLLDQLAVYITFATTTAALEHSILVLTGAEVFQWMSWCNKFTRYCFQIGGGLFAGYAHVLSWPSFPSSQHSTCSGFTLHNIFSSKSPPDLVSLPISCS